MIKSGLKILKKYFDYNTTRRFLENTAEELGGREFVQFIIDERNYLKKPQIRKNVRIYSIGDIHGNIDLFNKSLNRIKKDIEARPIIESHIVLLGDYIDRGLESREILETIIAEESKRLIIPLKGNHEDMLLRALDNEKYFRSWCDFGGIQTIFSYGVDVQELMVGKGHDKGRNALRSSIPERHLSWLRSLRAQWQYDDFFFCHAGVDPARPLDAQSEEDLLWVRRDFLEYTAAFAKIIVHGHTPVEAVDFRTNRINLDTGAYFSGKLSCIAIDSEGIQLV